MKSGAVRYLAWVVVGALLTGCAVQKERPPDDVVPADFSAFYAGDRESDSVVLASGDNDAVRLMMVSPNVVMESSRSSLSEPSTTGPRGGTVETPYLSDALGHPVRTRASTRLLDYLSFRNYEMVSPITSFTACGPKRCGNRTWVERVAQVYGPYFGEDLEEAEEDDEGETGSQQRPPAAQNEDGTTERRVPMPRVQRPQKFEEEELFQIPTSAFGVRSLGFRMARMRVRVEEVGANRYVLKPDIGAADSECPDMLLPVAVVEFEGELVQLDNGQLLARVFERLRPDIGESTQREVARYRHVPSQIYRRGLAGLWLEEWDDLDAQERHEVAGAVREWEEVDTLCESIVDEAMALYTIGLEEIRDQERELVQDLIEEAMDPWPW